MGIVDFVVMAVVLAIIGGAVFYIYKSKKNGKKCIGCPDSGSCSGTCGSCSCNCGCAHNKK